ncbi:MAG: hypothetical protein IPJ84_17980 [Bdellovibrionales bacterium]|nr:hypothetical protein [Bdellovibrionales bacterium]
MLKNLALTTLSIFALSSTFSSAAHADQCAWIEKGDRYVVKSAKRLLNADAEFVEYCALCGEDPGKVQNVSESNIQFAKMGEDVFNGTNGREVFYEVTINGKAQDLAYVYVRTGARVFGNVAMLSGCPVQGVPPFLYTAPGKRATPISLEQLATGSRKPASEEKAKK